MRIWYIGCALAFQAREMGSSPVIRSTCLPNGRPILYESPTNDMNDNIVKLDEYRPHEVSELICLKCSHRWIAVYPEELLLKNIECKCGKKRICN